MFISEEKDGHLGIQIKLQTVCITLGGHKFNSLRQKFKVLISFLTKLSLYRGNWTKKLVDTMSIDHNVLLINDKIWHAIFK